MMFYFVAQKYVKPIRNEFFLIIYLNKVGTFTNKLKQMKCTINVYLLNEHFSEEHAQANNDGKESELNPRYEWEDELAITSDVVDIKIHENSVYPLQGTMPDGEPFDIEVPKMRLFEIISLDAPIAYIGCSESILEDVELVETPESYTLKIYIKDYEPMSNPIPGVYIAAQEFPKKLVF